MTFYYPPFNQSIEPNESNIRQWMDNLYARFQPIEQARWNQSNIDTLFYAGAQTFVNRHFNFSPTSSYQQYYFNLCQQPVNMMTGYQRQNRKSVQFIPSEGGDNDTTDQYTRMLVHQWNTNGLHENHSRACELACISAMVLVQPYLDYTGEDPAQGVLKHKVWEYNSFLVDPYFRNFDMSDAQFMWFQEYISKQEAEARFREKINKVTPMAGSPQRYGNFYFLPENYNMSRNDLLVLSYVWYKWKKKRKKLYSKHRNQFFDMAQNAEMEALLYHIPDLEVVTAEVPTWRLATVLNDQLMFLGDNPLGFDKSPAVMVPWNYEPHISYYDLRARSLVRTMRDPQFLFNYKIITNNDIAAAVINSGWKRKSGSVANEDNLKKSQGGWDVIINEGFEMSDCEKILPTAIPESDLALATQMQELIFSTSGINLENWAGQQDKQTSSLTQMLKTAANLMVFQKYFDQWDYAQKLLGELDLEIILNNWNAEKVGLILGEEPTAFFYSKIFARYQTIVEPGLLTPTQKSFQAQQMMDINAAFGREVLPPSMIIKDMNIQGKAEIMQYLQQQEQQSSHMQQEASQLEHVFQEAKLKELYSKSAANIATARERHGRAESNIGLFEERLSEISHNRAMSTKAKVEALQTLVETIGRYGEIETAMDMGIINAQDETQIIREDAEKADAKRTSLANEFFTSIMSGNQQQQPQPNQGEMAVGQ